MPENQQPTGDQSASRIIAVALRRWFSSPPRPHGEIINDRVVSFLELFYDLVFVVLVAEVAHTLAGHLTWTGALDFAAVFGLIWVAWLNGSLYQDLHGGDDGRSRRYIFNQMLLLVLLAVYAGHATTEDGVPFAIVYVLLICYIAHQWWRIRRVDTGEGERRTVRNYVLRLLLLAVIVGASSLLPHEARAWVWLGTVLIWNAVTLLGFRRAQHTTGARLTMATESMSERFGLLTILVLGEVVVGVVNGLIEAERTPIAIVTGLLALGIGFGFWWNYFDAVGRRLPMQLSQTTWIFAQLPLQASIAAAGAGMISLIEHAGEAHTPAGTTWLLTGASAAMLACLGILVGTIEYDPVRATIRNTMKWSYFLGAVISLGIGVLAPAPWVLALGLAAVHSIIWTLRFCLLALARARAGETADVGTNQ